MLRHFRPNSCYLYDAVVIPMKPTLFLAFVFLFAACSGWQKPAAHLPAMPPVYAMPAAQPHADSLQIQLLPMMEEQMKLEYGANCDMRRQVTDSDVELYFYGATDSASSDSMVMMYIVIMTQPSRFPVCRGDMDGDGRPDVVVTVHTEGGGGGGNAWWDEHLLFLADSGGGYRLADAEPDGAINGCGGGYFACDTIINGLLLGTASCYAPGDGHCCPSLEYCAKVKYTHGKLVFAGKN